MLHPSESMGGEGGVWDAKAQKTSEVFESVYKGIGIWNQSVVAGEAVFKIFKCIKTEEGLKTCTPGHMQANCSY